MEAEDLSSLVPRLEELAQAEDELNSPPARCHRRHSRLRLLAAAASAAAIASAALALVFARERGPLASLAPYVGARAPE